MRTTPEQTIGYLAQVACTWEVLARKLGNVCPGREYPDLTVNDFLVSAGAIAPILDRGPKQPIGLTILQAIEATRKAVATNTNLGIVLLLAPLASIPLGQPLQPALGQKLRELSVEDSRNVYAAIRLAKPSGLGKVPEQDVQDEPTLPLLDLMALAENTDRIAAEYASDFYNILTVIVPELIQRVRQRNNIEQAIIEIQLSILSRYIDSHIRRKRGVEEAKQVKVKASDIVQAEKSNREDFLAFDAFLRADNHARNPGTTADLLTAGLFVALREQAISLKTPFAWDGHPFANP